MLGPHEKLNLSFSLVSEAAPYSNTEINYLNRTATHENELNWKTIQEAKRFHYTAEKIFC